MKAKLIGCLSVKPEIESLHSSLALDYEFLDFGLHGVPKKLQEQLQNTIRNSHQYDLIILTYSRCSNTLEGLISEFVPMLLPKTHDCISLLLGSDERRAALNKRNSGAYYFSPGWLTYGLNPWDEYLGYVERFGEKSADYLIKTLYGQYTEAIYIDTCQVAGADQYREQVREIAKFFSWKVSEVRGDLTLLKSIVNGSTALGALYVPAGQPVLLGNG